jgi:tetratricopeptide (TPR) repeat protein
VRYRELSETRKRQIRYGALAIAVLLLAAGVIAFSRSNPRLTANPDTTAPPRSAQAQAAPAKPDPDDDLTPTISALRRDEAVDLLGEAHRQAAAGNFAAAEATLQKAKKAAPDLPEVEQARRDIEQLRTPEGGFASQLKRAQLAIDHDDTAAAEAALAEASRLKPDAPEIATLRAALQQSQEKSTRREARIAQALTRMREAVVRRDFGAADSALNEAERIDIQNPSIRRARGELARARGAQPNSPE